MPKVSTIAEVMQMDDSDPIKAIRLTITKVFKARSGGEGQKAYHFQDCEVSDGAHTMKMTLSGRPEIGKDWEGTESYVCCIQSDKHGWTGVKVKDQSYVNSAKKQVDERVIWVTGSAEFIAPDDFGTGEEGGDQNEPAAHQPTAAPARTTTAPPPGKAKPAPAAKPAPPKPLIQKPAQNHEEAPPQTTTQRDPVADLKKARLFLGQHANACSLSLQAGLYAVKDFMREVGALAPIGTPEQEVEVNREIISNHFEHVRSVGMGIYISLGKSGNASLLPSGPVHKIKTEGGAQ